MFFAVLYPSLVQLNLLVSLLRTSADLPYSVFYLEQPVVSSHDLRHDEALQVAQLLPGSILTHIRLRFLFLPSILMPSPALTSVNTQLFSPGLPH